MASLDDWLDGFDKSFEARTPKDKDKDLLLYALSWHKEPKYPRAICSSNFTLIASNKIELRMAIMDWMEANLNQQIWRSQNIPSFVYTLAVDTRDLVQNALRGTGTVAEVLGIQTLEEIEKDIRVCGYKRMMHRIIRDKKTNIADHRSASNDLMNEVAELERALATVEQSV